VLAVKHGFQQLALLFRQPADPEQQMSKQGSQ
jgi:hypothetical protein